MQLERIDQLAYRINPDGSVDLEQDLGTGNVERVFLHRLHLRLLLEEVGHILPPPTADELIKRTANQLCEILGDLANEAGISSGVDRAIDRLTALVELLPGRASWPEDDKTAASDRPAFELTHTQAKEDKPCSTPPMKR